MRWKLKLGLVVAATASSMGLNAVASERIAVQSFTATGVEASVASIIESSFCSALVEEKVDALCPDALVAIIQNAQTRAGLGAACGDNDAECLTGLAKSAETSRVISGDVARLSDTFQLTVTLIDTESNTVLVRATERAKKPEGLLDKVNPLAKKIAAKK